jgi:hypothetical protein
MRHGMLSLTHPGDFIYFLAYALAGLVPPLSSFFLVLLEHYGLQLQHLSPHSITLVVIFTHFCEMFMGVRPSVHMYITTLRRLLLPAPDEGSFKVHHYPQARQVGALEGGLGAGANRRPWVIDAVDR